MRHYRDKPEWMRALPMVFAVALGACSEHKTPPRGLAGADAERGLQAIKRVGCSACHTIPGVAWPKGGVGAPLDGFAERPFIAGRLPNQPDVLALWLRDPPALAPDTAMPPSPLSETEARDVAAYLYTLR